MGLHHALGPNSTAPAGAPRTLQRESNFNGVHYGMTLAI